MTDPLPYFAGGASDTRLAVARSSRTLRPLRFLEVEIRELILTPRRLLLAYIKRLRKELHRLRGLVLWGHALDGRPATDPRLGGYNRYILRFIQQQLRDTRRFMERGVDGPYTPATRTLQSQFDALNRAMVDRNWGGPLGDGGITLRDLYRSVAIAIQRRRAYDGVAGDGSLQYGPGL